jgi:cell division transport system ATP-binding protein
VWKSYHDQPVLQNVSLHIGPAEGVILTGASGAGKTTLLRLLYAAEQPDSGSIFIAGRDICKLRRSSIPYVRRNIGVVFQDFKLLGSRTARQNVALALEVLGLGRREIATRVHAALSAVDLLAEADQPVETLAGGLKQRVAVARALCTAPQILLCDEPTGNLDPLRARGLLNLLSDIRERGTTVVIATHDPTVIAFGAARGWQKLGIQAGSLISLGSGASNKNSQPGESV